jgi:hypothetical protein
MLASPSEPGEQAALGGFTVPISKGKSIEGRKRGPPGKRSAHDMKAKQKGFVPASIIAAAPTAARIN